MYFFLKVHHFKVQDNSLFSFMSNKISVTPFALMRENALLEKNKKENYIKRYKTNDMTLIWNNDMFD